MSRGECVVSRIKGVSGCRITQGSISKEWEGFCQNASGLTRFFLEAGHVISHEAGGEGVCGRGGNCPGTEDGLVLRLN